MILSPTHFDTPTAGETTLPLLQSDTPSKGTAQGDLVRADRSRSSSFDAIFADGDAQRSNVRELAAHSMPQAGQIMDATQRDKPDGNALAIIDTDSAENIGDPRLPDATVPDTPQTTRQLAQVAPSQSWHSSDFPETPPLTKGGMIKPSGDVPDFVVKPYDALPPVRRVADAGQADTPKALVGAIPQDGQATAYDLAAQSGAWAVSKSLEASAVMQKTMHKMHNQAPVSGSNPDQFITPDKSPADTAPLVLHIRAAAAELPDTAIPAAQKHMKAALTGLVAGAAAKAEPPNAQLEGRGDTSSLAAMGDRQMVLAGSNGAPQVLHPNSQLMGHAGIAVEVAKRGDHSTKDAPVLASGATSVVSDGANPKLAQTFPKIAKVLPAASTGFAPIEDISLSRAGSQPDVGAVVDQRPPAQADFMNVGRSDGPARPDLPRNVAAQLAEAVQRGGGGDRPIELTLNPAELGRVRISMAPGDGTIIVTVLAERGETLDLMRRHADQLAQDFHDLGYGSAEFAFGQNSDGPTPDQGRGDGGALAQTEPKSSRDVAPQQIQLSADRVDIRL